MKTKKGMVALLGATVCATSLSMAMGVTASASDLRVRDENSDSKVRRVGDEDSDSKIRRIRDEDSDSKVRRIRDEDSDSKVRRIRDEDSQIIFSESEIDTISELVNAWFS